MAKQIVWTKRSVQRFDSIIDYLQSEWGETVTKKFIEKTYSLIDLLSEQPELGMIENKQKEIRGFLVTKHNRLFYRVTENEIIILNFFDT